MCSEIFSIAQGCPVRRLGGWLGSLRWGDGLGDGLCVGVAVRGSWDGTDSDLRSWICRVVVMMLRLGWVGMGWGFLDSCYQT